MRIDCKFREIVNENYNSIALCSKEEKNMSYGELNEFSDNVAENLKTVQEPVIGICIERSFNMIIALLGILKSNKAYLPLDDSYPEDRLEYMLIDANVHTIICSDATIHLFKNYNINILNIDKLKQQDGKGILNNTIIKNDDLQIAYVLYTSGSTGKPHGVVVTHKSIMNTLLWRINYYEFSKNDKTLQIPSLSFDSSVEDIFCTLLSGGTLYLVTKTNLLNTKYLALLIKNENITNILCVPSFYSVLLPELSEESALRFVVVAGESLSTILMREHYNKFDNVTLYNEYGPTENSVCSTVFECKKDSDCVLIGKPINNVTYLIYNDEVDNDNNYGELLLGGKGLAEGYYNDSKYTEEKFIYINNNRYYRTGDYVELITSGDLKFCGRMDQQIKLNGIRFDLFEIDQILNSKGIKDAYTLLVCNDDNTKHIITFINENNAVNFNILDLLSRNIPKQFVPERIIKIREFNYLPNGKLDYNYLKNFYRLNYNDNLIDSSINDTKENSLLKIILNILSKYLKRNILGDEYDIDIREVGLNSLDFIRFLVDIEDEFDFEFAYDEIDKLKKVSVNAFVDFIYNKTSE